MPHSRKRRVGFLLANIYSGSSNKIWPAMAEEAERHNTVLFIFPGGRLGEKAEHEHLRNHIFDLVHRGTVDGIVSWASAVCEHVSDEESREFHARYDGLPVVTLTRKVGDLPFFGIDSYGGMVQLMEHLLDGHGYRKPAFIRGPDPHPQASERFRAFTDALGARGLAADPRLISEPCSWIDGGNAALDFLDRRELQPGSDFDVLVAASDMLLFGACRVFQSRGYQIPGDFAIAGFNDSEESRILWPSFTTVRMPFEEQSVAAFRALLALIRGAAVESEVRLASRLVIRQSCGCRQDVRDVIVPDGGGDDREALVQAMLGILSCDDEERVAWVEPLVASFIASLRGAKPDRFVDTLQRILVKVMQTGREIHPWQDVLSLLRSFALARNRGDLDALVEDLTNRSRIIVSETLWRANTFKHWHDGQVLRMLGAFDKDLLLCRNRGSLSGVMAKHLPLLGIRCAFLVTYEPGAGDEARQARLVAGFQTGGAATDAPVELADTVFPSSALLPQSLLSGLRPGSYIVQPLFIEEEPLGYLVLRTGAREGFMYESIRSALSSALKGILLFEEVSRARAAAERAQALKNRFLANVSAELQNPPLEIRAACERLSALLERAGGGERQAMAAQLEAIDCLSRRQLGYANDLMDLALTQVDELPLSREIFRPLPLLEEAAAAARAADHRVVIGLDSPGRLPLVHWDRQRIRRILEILFDRAGQTAGGRPVTVRVAVRVPYIEIRIFEAVGPPGEIALSLARNLTLLHAGTLESEPAVDGGRPVVCLRLPVPNLEGSTLLAGGRDCDTLLALSSRATVPPELAGYGTASGCRVRAVTPALLMKDAVELTGAPALAWDMDQADISEWIFIQSLRLREALPRMPLLILTANPELPEAPDLRRFFKAIPAALGSGPIVLVDPADARRSGFATLLRERCGIGDLIDLGGIEEVPVLLEDRDVGLLILNTLDGRDIELIKSVPWLSAVPVLVFTDRLKALEEIEPCLEAPKVVLCNRDILEPAEIRSLIERMRRGDGRHGPPTSGLVKKAILYLNLRYASALSRWKLADYVHVNEDYLTRIFHRELGLTPWEYLNRYRIRVAEGLLRATSHSIRAIALETGFRDQAYFCRVFHAITGLSPSEFRERTDAVPK